MTSSGSFLKAKHTKLKICYFSKSLLKTRPYPAAKAKKAEALWKL